MALELLEMKRNRGEKNGEKGREVERVGNMTLILNLRFVFEKCIFIFDLKS